MSAQDRVAIYEATLRDIAATVVHARARTPLGSMRLPDGVGENLLSDLELHLSRLILLGAVPAQPPTRVLGGTCHCDGPPHAYDRNWCPPEGPRR